MKLSGIITGIILAAGLFFSGLYIGKTHFPKEIKVQGKTITKTVYKYKYLQSENKPVFDQDNFNRLLYCYDSPLLFEDRTQGNTLHIKAYDECKEAEAQYKIGVRNNYAVYLTITLLGVGTGLAIYHIFH